MADMNQQNNQVESNTQTINHLENKEQKMTEEKNKVTKKAKENDKVKIVDNPVRQLPAIINEVLEKNFTVILSKTGYYIEGFYGLNPDGKTGYAFGQETVEPNVLVFYDAKGHKHVIKSFEDLVKFNSSVWGVFYKQSDEYKKPNAKWFGYMLEFGVLNITPGK